MPLSAGYAYMRWFHGPSGRIMVATPTMRKELEDHGFRNTVEGGVVVAGVVPQL